MSAFDDIRAWVVGRIQSVTGYQHVYSTTRIIETDAQLEEDFGLGAPPEGELQQRTHGWTITIRGREPEELDHGNALQSYAVQATCYSSIHARGGSEADFQNHALAVANSLQADLTPAALPNVYDVSAVAIEFETVEFPIFSGRLHHRAILNWTVRTTEAVRS